MASDTERTNDPSEEELLKSPLKLHHMYLFREKKTHLAFKKLVQLSKEGYECLLFVRAHPEHLKEKYNLGEMNIIWLSSSKLPEYTSVAPHEISRITTILVKFITSKEEGKRVILFDNIEYLIIQNEFRTILRMLHLIRDKIMIHPVVFLMSIDPNSLETKELSLIERECEVIDVGDY
jgi:two-component system cell cycle response regulator